MLLAVISPINLPDLVPQRLQIKIVHRPQLDLLAANVHDPTQPLLGLLQSPQGAADAGQVVRDDLVRGKFLDRQVQRVAGLLRPIKFAWTAGAVWLKRCLNLTAWPICTKILVGRS